MLSFLLHFPLSYFFYKRKNIQRFFFSTRNWVPLQECGLLSFNGWKDHSIQLTSFMRSNWNRLKDELLIGWINEKSVSAHFAGHCMPTTRVRWIRIRMQQSKPCKCFPLIIILLFLLNERKRFQFDGYGSVPSPVPSTTTTNPEKIWINRSLFSLKKKISNPKNRPGVCRLCGL